MARGVNTLVDEVNIFVQAQDITALIVSVTVTGTFNGEDIINYGLHKGGYFVIGMASMNATSTVRMNIQGKDAASGGYYTIASLSVDAVSVTTTGNLAQAILIYPAIASLGVNGANIQTIGVPLPKVYRVQASITYQATSTVNGANFKVGVSKLL